MLEQRLVCEVRIRDRQSYDGDRVRYEATLVSEDGQTLYFYEGQLKSALSELEVGAHYLVTFEPVINNRWVELRIAAVEPVER